MAHSTKDSSASSRITIMSNGEKVDILDESGLGIRLTIMELWVGAQANS